MVLLFKRPFMKNLSLYSLFLICALPITTYSAAPNTVVATINVGVTPAGLAITPDNRFAYVTNNNNYSLPNQDTVSVLNLSNNTLLTTILLISPSQF